DQYGNRDYRYSGKVNIKGPDSINYPVETFLKEGYIEIKEAITFKNEYFPSSVVEDLLINRKAYGSLPLVPEIIKNIAKIVVESAEETENGNILKGVSNPIVWDKDYVKKQLFFGDTHIHTREFSEGMGTGEDAFNYAKNNSLLDFAALGDHLNQRSNLWMDGKKFIEYPLTQEEWNKLVNLCEKYTDESFVA
ncbi:MAG: hypothetical protein GY870_16095, partial [archaeon]|nr:hypothetical protein [archaeon]